MEKTVALPKRVVTLQDLSCFGRCSLTVVIPTLSVMGYQVLPLPTALLSTHTGGFFDFSFRELTEDMEKILTHWETLSLKTDGIYSGFLGSVMQIETVRRCIAQFNSAKRPLVLVDPAMADNGALYQTITHDIVIEMRSLCAEADVITPNLTEAMLLLEEPYRIPAREELPTILKRLQMTGAKAVVVTGIPFADRQTIGTATLNEEKEFSLFEQPQIPCAYPGTGDIFASVLLGKLLSGTSLSQSAAFASSFVSELILDTAKANTPPREGVLLERHLGKLLPSQ